MRSPHEMYVETVATALHGKYGGAGTPSWTRVKDEVRAEWCRDAREVLDEIRPDLRYVTARGQDHFELSEALGVEPGLFEWHRLIELVRDLRSVGQRPTGEFARAAATTDIVRAVLRILSSEYADPYAHSDDDVALAEDMLLDAARRLVAARAGVDPLMAPPEQLSNDAARAADAEQVLTFEEVDRAPIDDRLTDESIRRGMVIGHPSLYPLSTRTGRITDPVEDPEA